MVLRKSGWRISALAVVCCATASLSSGALAQNTGNAMVWGGRLPAAGEGYTPSVPSRGGQEISTSQSQQSRPSARVQTPQQANERALIDDLLGRSLPPASVGTQPGMPTTPDAAGFPADPATLPPLTTPTAVDADPWRGLKQVTPGAVAPPAAISREVTPPSPLPRRGIVAAIGTPHETARPPAAVPGRGRLERETPSGYVAMPRSEAMCRRALRKMGVKFVDVAPVGKGGACGIPYPVKVLEIARGVRMQPAATLNCKAAARISKWVEDEVKPAARWRLWTRPTAVLNASSYRCSRIAGSRTISEHASGNALDVRGFKFADGSTFDVEKKGFFSFRQKGFQKSVRRSGCRYFGTVLGPGYNRAHADHLHLDAKNRRRGVCK